MDLERDFEQFVVPKSLQNRSKTQMCFKSNFKVNFCLQNQGSIYFRGDWNPSKCMDCCSQIDVVHFRNTSKVSSSPDSNLVLKSINFWQHLDPKSKLKQTASFDAVVVPKVFQNVIQKEPKMCDRNCGKRPWGHFGHIKPLIGWNGIAWVQEVHKSMTSAPAIFASMGESVIGKHFKN